jgi:dTDP-4-dehydrorhamnose reductase
MNIVIVGAGGQLGSDCGKLLSGKHQVVSRDLPQVDIGDAGSVARLLEETRPQVIINCAAYTAVDACESNLELSWRINALGPRFLAEGAARHQARLIHISTDYVFDGHRPAPQPYVEDDAPNPLSQYGRSKLAGEEAVIKACANHVILRTAWLYGATGKNFLKTMLRLAVADPHRQLKVVDDQHGSLTWSRTLARQIEQLLDGGITGIVHATSEGHATWYEVARTFLTAMGLPFSMRPCTTAEYPTPAHRPANSILENRVLHQAGCNLFVDWRQDLEHFVAAHKEALLAEARA